MEARFSGLLRRRSLDRRVVRRPRPRPAARPDGRGLRHRAAAAADVADALGPHPRPRGAPPAERLFRRRLARRLAPLRRRSGPLRILGIPPRLDGADLPLRPERGRGEHRSLDGGAADALFRRFGRREDRPLPPRRAALRRRTARAPRRRHRQPRNGAAGGARLSGRARRHRPLGGQRLKGLLLAHPLSEPRRHEPRLLVPLDDRQAGAFRRPVPFLRRGRTGRALRGRARQPSRQRPRGAPADDRPSERGRHRAGELRPRRHGGRGGGAPRHAAAATAPSRGALLRKFLRQLLPHRPRAGLDLERLPRPDAHVAHEADPQVSRTPLDRPLAGPRGVPHLVRLRRRPQLHEPVLLHVRHGVAGALLAEGDVVRRPRLEMGLRRPHRGRLVRRGGDPPLGRGHPVPRGMAHVELARTVRGPLRSLRRPHDERLRLHRRLHRPLHRAGTRLGGVARPARHPRPRPRHGQLPPRQLYGERNPPHPDAVAGRRRARTARRADLRLANRPRGDAARTAGCAARRFRIQQGYLRPRPAEIRLLRLQRRLRRGDGRG